jgi:acetyltransferase
LGGGVARGRGGPRGVGAPAAAMQQRVAARLPSAHISGFVVEPMVQRPGAYELSVGTTVDEQFGPLVLFGHGGTAVEVIDDTAIGLPPLNMHLARALIGGTRIARLLAGFRDRPAVNLDAVAMTLIRISQMIVDLPELTEMDINPLLADEYGVLALDVRVSLAPADRPGAERLAIRPYPSELEQTVPLGDGRTMLLRPIRPEDEPALQAAFARLTPEEVRLRFFVPLKTFSHMITARFTQIDYDREMVLILTEPGIAGSTEIYGVVQISADPDNRRAEYAIVIRSDVTGMGLGVFLMRRIIDYAKSRRIGAIYGDVLGDNSTMLKLCRVLGFTESPSPHGRDVVRVTLEL